MTCGQGISAGGGGPGCLFPFVFNQMCVVTHAVHVPRGRLLYVQLLCLSLPNKCTRAILWTRMYSNLKAPARSTAAIMAFTGATYACMHQTTRVHILETTGTACLNIPVYSWNYITYHGQVTVTGPARYIHAWSRISAPQSGLDPQHACCGHGYTLHQFRLPEYLLTSLICQHICAYTVCA